MKKKFLALFIVFLIALLSFTLVACDDGDGAQNNDDNLCGGPPYPSEQDPPAGDGNNSGGNTPSGDSNNSGGDNTPAVTPVDVTKAVSFISIDINPSIELTVNCENKVLSVYGANEDGKVLLYGEDGIVGEDVETAIAKITSLAIDLGYLSADNNVVQTSAVSADGSSKALLDKIDECVTATAAERNLSAKTSPLDLFSLSRRLDECKQLYPDNSAIDALSQDKFKIVLSVAEESGKDIQTLASMSDEELIKAASECHLQAKPYQTDEYKKESSAATEIYEKALGVVTDGIYTSYYMLHHPLRAYYGLAYQGYKMTSRGVKFIANAIDRINDLREYPLSEKHIANAVRLLGLDSADEITNANGDVTVKSIEAYADRKFKETDFSASLEEMKADLKAALKDIETEIKITADKLSEKYAEELEVIANSFSAIAEGLKGFESLLPQPIQSAINDFKQTVNDVWDVISDFKITVDEIHGLSDKLQAQSNASLAQIENDLTADERAEIADIQQSAIESIDHAKKQFEEAIKNAEQSAKQHLESLKNERMAA